MIPFSLSVWMKLGLTRFQIYESDPVRTTQLTQYVDTKIGEAGVACGGAGVLQAQWLAKADPTVLKQIQDALTGKYQGIR